MREVELCRELGISRIPLREALRRLVGEGLLVPGASRGVVVSSFSETELLQIAEVCRLLEGHLLRLAIPNLDAGSMRRARTWLRRLDEIDDLVAWSRANWSFHAELYAAARRPLELELVAGLRAKAERYVMLVAADPKRRRALNREHRAILAACLARSVARGAKLLDAHLEGGRDQVLRLLEPSP